MEEIIKSIQDAFRDVTREGGISLHEAGVIDDYGTFEERKAARQLDLDKHWSEIKDEDIEKHDVLCFMDPIGFRYHVPAYMIWALKHLRKTDSLVIDTTIYSFALGSDEESRQWYQERFNLLDKKQRKAVALFLEYMAKNTEGFADEEVAQKALDSYWGQYL